MKLDAFKTEIKACNTTAFNFLDMKLSDLTSKKPYYSCEQPSDDIIQWTLLKSLEKSSHASQFAKHLSPKTLKGDTLLQTQKWWEAILCAF